VIDSDFGFPLVVLSLSNGVILGTVMFRVMTAYCLIHGSGQGPEGWKLLVHELKQRGHSVLTPAFEVNRTDQGLIWHAETIVNALDRSGMNPVDVICVAHSASGMYLPLIADRWSPRRMVFLAAVVPRPGMSVMEQHSNDPSMFNPAWVRQNPQDEKVALEFVYHDCPPDRLGWALSTRVMFYARRALEEPCPLRAWPQVPSSYIMCADDRTITPEWQRKAARELLGVEPIELPGGHCPHVSRPEAIADALMRIDNL
jgi:pimeloyl-ACP methyl ester carboxylesterase